MYGLIGRILAIPGESDALLAILLASSRDMPGCLSYIIATDPADPDARQATAPRCRCRPCRRPSGKRDR